MKKLLIILFTLIPSYSYSLEAQIKVSPELTKMGETLERFSLISENIHASRLGLVIVGSVAACYSAKSLFNPEEKVNKDWRLPAFGLAAGTGLIILSGYLYR